MPHAGPQIIPTSATAAAAEAAEAEAAPVPDTTEAAPLLRSHGTHGEKSPVL